MTDESDWWNIFINEQFPNKKCLDYFKCSRKTFLLLIKTLKPYIEPKIRTMQTKDPMSLRKSVSIEKQIAILLYKLTTNSDYSLMSKKFKVHKTTIHNIIYKCVIVINKQLLQCTINIPKSSEAELISKTFECDYQLPQIIGAMTIVHIPISSPINLNYKFLNSKLYPSFVLQSVVDSNNLFRDLSVRHAGATESHLILSDSNIYKYSNKVLPSEKRNIDGTEISYKIVSPTEGPLYSWLLSNYKIATLPEEISFNKCLQDIRNFAESVIARLRSRFLILSQMMDLNYKVAPQIIAACCIIHNICEKEGDPFLNEWLVECNERLRKFPQPETENKWDQPEKEILEERDVLKNFIKAKITSSANEDKDANGV